mmetsp:Transcript_90988/g.178091  ORF Transcript_90988/g.178091 Transcript_90988/m.178091 type:complete len:142 (-) Transcript_90988:523-948(-)
MEKTKGHKKNAGVRMIRRSYGATYKRPLQKPSSTNFAKSPRCPPPPSNQVDDEKPDLIKGNSNVEGRPIFRRRLSVCHHDWIHPYQKSPDSLYLHSWSSWPFKNRTILIDLTTSRPIFSSYHETLNSIDDFCGIHDCTDSR